MYKTYLKIYFECSSYSVDQLLVFNKRVFNHIIMCYPSLKGQSVELFTIRPRSMLLRKSLTKKSELNIIMFSD